MKFSEKLLTPNIWSRPGYKLTEVRAIAMHWTGAPANAWTAEMIRDYFESLKTGVERRYASAHYTIDPGETIKMLPFDEVGYHVGSSAHPERYTEYARQRLDTNPNWFCIGIEMCHDQGEFDPRTVHNAAGIVAGLLQKFPDADIIRHHDVTGKNCPKMWVDHPEQFEAFKEAVKELLPDFARV